MGRDREADEQTLLTLSHNKECTIAWTEEGGGLVYRLWDMYVLFEIPQFGGKERYIGIFHESQVDELLNLVYSWT